MRHSFIETDKESVDFNLTYEMVNDLSIKISTQVQKTYLTMCRGPFDQDNLMRRFKALVQLHKVDMPNKVTFLETYNRLSNPSWWKRQLKKRFRLLEHRAIQNGEVHCNAGKYVSEKCLNRKVADKNRTSKIMDSLIAINETTGEIVEMKTLIEASQANPTNRRKGLMVTVKGMENFADKKGFIGIFVTLTCPSRMHARHSNGFANKHYDGTCPRLAQAYLNNVWRRAMRAISHQKIDIFGLRVTEPHHDGCPHWHILLFVDPCHEVELLQTLQRYALEDSGDEPGASKHRFNSKIVDKKKGSALGYVSKYISKNIDGFGVDQDSETHSCSKDSSLRIGAWASQWGIRQFQRFGIPPVTASRELYKIEKLDTPTQEVTGLINAHEAVKRNDHCDWMLACQQFQLKFKVIYTERESQKYKGELVRAVKGISVSSLENPIPLRLITRLHSWRIQKRTNSFNKPHVPVTWTRFNNCAGVDLIEVFPTQLNEEKLNHPNPIQTNVGFAHPEFKAAMRVHPKSDFGGANAAAH